MTKIWNAGWLSPLTGGESGTISHHTTRTGAVVAIVDHIGRRLEKCGEPLTEEDRAALNGHLAMNEKLAFPWSPTRRGESIKGMDDERRERIGDHLDEIYTLSEAPLLP